MNEKGNIHTNNTLKVPEIPKQKHPVYLFNKVSPEKISRIAQLSKSTRMNSFADTPSQI